MSSILASLSVFLSKKKNLHKEILGIPQILDA